MTVRAPALKAMRTPESHRLRERRHVASEESDDHVDILCGPRFAVDGARDGSADHPRDTEGVEAYASIRGDLDRVVQSRQRREALGRAAATRAARSRPRRSSARRSRMVSSVAEG